MCGEVGGRIRCQRLFLADSHIPPCGQHTSVYAAVLKRASTRRGEVECSTKSLNSRMVGDFENGAGTGHVGREPHCRERYASISVAVVGRPLFPSGA
jgi:hypothetical protein